MPKLLNPAFRLDEDSDVLEVYTGAGWVPTEGLGGMVINARAANIAGDDTIEEATQVQNLINNSPVGCTLDFRTLPGAIRTAVPIDLIENRAYLWGDVNGRWIYQQTSPYKASIKPTSAFSGDSVVRVRERTLTGRTRHNDGVVVDGLVVDCGAASGNIDGFRVEGLCRSLELRNFSATNAKGTGRGVHMLQGAGSAPPRGVTCRRVASYAGNGFGLRFNGVTDSDFYDLLAVGNGDTGIYFSNSGENFIHGRSVFNTGRGWLFDGTVSVGMSRIMAATDRNTRGGIRVTQSGVSPLQFIMPQLRRDCSALTANDAAIEVVGSAGLTAVPIDLVIPQSMPGVNDDTTGNRSPANALYATYAQRVTIHGGDMWATTTAIVDGGNNIIIDWDPSTDWSTGNTSRTRAFPVPITNRGALYLDAGALKYKGGGGTITIVGAS